MGENEITARVNWDDRHNETDPNDNSVSTTINVTPYEYDLYINEVATNSYYREGTSVITSFMIYNDRDQDILPEHNNTVLFRAYYTPTINGKRVARNIYAPTEEECEAKLAEMIREIKEEIRQSKQGNTLIMA